MKKHSLLLLLTIAVVTLSSCNSLIYDDLSDCVRTRLFFSYKGDGETEILDKKINSANLYFYNNQGDLVLEEKIDQPQLLTSNGYIYRLDPGKYTIVAIGNQEDKSIVQQKEKLSEGILLASDLLDNNSVKANDSLYYASKEILIESERISNDTLVFRSAHIKINLGIKGLEEETNAGQESPLGFRIKEIPRHMTMTGIPSEERISCTPMLQIKKPYYVTSLNTLRFNENNPILIELYEKESDFVLKTLSLEKFIQDHSIAIDGIHEASISIMFIVNGANISIDTWQSENVVPEF